MENGSGNRKGARHRWPLSVIPLANWPERDQQTWAAALAPASLFDDRPSLARYGQARLPQLRAAYGRWLGYLRSVDLLSSGTSGIDRLDPDHIAGFVAALSHHLASCTVRNYVTALYVVVRHMDPDQDHDALRRAVNACRWQARPEGMKAQRMVAAHELYDLGFALMEQAEAMRQDQQPIPLRALQLYRDGLAIAMLIARPIRIGNFGRLEIDRHLIRLDECYRLVLEGHEVKTGRFYELDLPDALTAPIDRYLEAYRPHLLARSGRWCRRHDGDALWISRDGAPFRPKCLSARIVKITTRHLGHAVNPHLFRDCAATSIATDLPEHVRIIAPVLGHTHVQTGERFYNQARSLQAGQRYQDIIASLREELS